MKRIRHLFNTLSTNWASEPAARGAAKMTAGAILVAEGLFGVVSGIIPDGFREKRSGGILGSLIGLVFGGIFIAVSLFMKPGNYKDEVRTSGIVAAVETSRGNKGNAMYQAVYSFQANGQEYRFSPSYTSGSRPTIGDSVKIAYSASNPGNARRVDGLGGNVHWLFFGAGALVLIASLLSAIVSLAMIILGVWLFFSGRKDRKSVNDNSGFFSDLMSLAGRARTGEINIARTAVGQPGSLQGDLASPPPPPSMPPAGWYADPDDSSRQRWWDGAQWTDQFQ